MISICADYLPRLAAETCNKDKLKRYCLRLLRVRQSAMNKLINEIFGDAQILAKQQFVDKL
jgi:hypothetical protein